MRIDASGAIGLSGTNYGTSGQVLTSQGSGSTPTWSNPTTVSTTLYRIRALISGTTYTVPSDVKSFYAFVFGATGGTNGNNKGGPGGPGYSEKYYSSPAASYTYAIGAAGTTSGTAGGSTTFDVITVTGGGGTTGSTGAAGGAGSGGDFNATGGTGGNYSGTSGGRGGPGGAGSRAGNGGNGGNGSGSTPGGGGGTGGNNASGTTDGAGASGKAAGALTLPINEIGVEYFAGGAASVGYAASGTFYTDNQSFNAAMFPGPASFLSAAISYAPWNTTAKTFAFSSRQATNIPCAINDTAATAGMQAIILLMEILK